MSLRVRTAQLSLPMLNRTILKQALTKVPNCSFETVGDGFTLRYKDTEFELNKNDSDRAFTLTQYALNDDLNSNNLVNELKGVLIRKYYEIETLKLKEREEKLNALALLAAKKEAEEILAEKMKFQEEKRKQIVEKATKMGYAVSEKRVNNTIQLILVKRTY